MMRTTKTIKLLYVGEYAAQIEVELMCTEGGWSPTLLLEDAQKLDDVRTALQWRDLETAASLARIYKLLPISI